ncbi:HepT-like ribonuclease domain-containing protein [Pseudobutyrivibrio sp.]|uniref:HepT-like ribonuclease domain-containing protein n=1 Tax=Pseudobutyrivibrio sp. TaxID=2014367 RepID=UPI001DF6E1B9|nr:HepT-like ribonuclease domain-containing protein [Pseudobutyrivibrio sp.]MBE5909914.1 DUF86 domain-containing protein [Pseudobutyrivibrio sp.]
MDNVKNDPYYLDRMKTDLEFINRNMLGVTKPEFEENEILQDSMMFRLIQISENARKLSEEYRNKNSIIPWKDIFGLRNKIVHDYGHVDLKIVYETLTYDIPDVLEMVKTCK